MKDLIQNTEKFLRLFGFTFSYINEEKIQQIHDYVGNELNLQAGAVYLDVNHPVFRIFMAIRFHEDSEGSWITTTYPEYNYQDFLSNWVFSYILKQRYSDFDGLLDFFFSNLEKYWEISLIDKNGLMATIYPQKGNYLSVNGTLTDEDEKYKCKFDGNSFDVWLAYINRKVTLDVLVEHLVDKNPNFYPLLENLHH